MKNFFSILIIGLLFCFGNVQAQQDAKAKSILDKVSAKYKEFKTIKANFKLIMENEEAGVSDEQSGSIMMKGEQYRIETTDLQRISDGTTIWTHIIEDEEVMISEFDEEENELSPAQLFTIYESGYKYMYVGDVEKDGVQFSNIDLSPEDRDSPYFKIRLTVNKLSNIITEAKVFSTNGTHIIYRLEKFTPNVVLDTNTFTFDTSKYPDVEVVDLR